MKKIIGIILFCASLSFAIQPFTYKWTIRLTGDTATVVKWRANNDSVLVWSGRISDTLNKQVPRWLNFKNHDSTFAWMNIDTLPSVDTEFVKNLKVTKSNNDSISTSSIHVVGDITIENNIHSLSKSGGFTMAGGDKYDDGGNIRVSGSTNATANSIGFFIGPSQKAKIDSVGRIGVGTNLPSEKLQVVGAARADSFTVDGLHYIKKYCDTTFACSLYCNGSLLNTTTARIIQTGKIIVFKCGPNFTGTADGYNDVVIYGIPTRFLPSFNEYVSLPILNNDTYATGILYLVGGGRPFIEAINGYPLTAGNGGIYYPVAITWMVQ